jgi:hypothetical protein
MEEDRRRAAARERIPYAGGPVPEGYRVVRGASALFAPGIALLLIGYAPALITGTIGVGVGGASTPLAWSYVPIVGMPLAAGLCGTSLCNSSPAGYLALLFGGSAASILQLTGLILAGIGGSAAPPYLVPESAAVARLRLAPWITADGAGLAVMLGAM